MEVFGIIGFSFSIIGMSGFVFSIIAIARITNLEKKLKEFDVLPEDYNSIDAPKKNAQNDN